MECVFWCRAPQLLCVCMCDIAKISHFNKYYIKWLKCWLYERQTVKHESNQFGSSPNCAICLRYSRLIEYNASSIVNRLQYMYVHKVVHRWEYIYIYEYYWRHTSVYIVCWSGRASRTRFCCTVCDVMWCDVTHRKQFAFRRRIVYCLICLIFYDLHKLCSMNIDNRH